MRKFRGNAAAFEIADELGNVLLKFFRQLFVRLIIRIPVLDLKFFFVVEVIKSVNHQKIKPL